MNTFGKILAVCNLLVAVATAGFILVAFSTRTNWKTGFDSIGRENQVLVANQRPIVSNRNRSNKLPSSSIRTSPATTPKRTSKKARPTRRR